MKYLVLSLLAASALAFPALDVKVANTTCKPEQTAQLVDGIQRNLDFQMDELKSLKTLQYLSTTANTTLRASNTSADPLYSVQQQRVTDLIKKAVDVRMANQKIAQAMKSPSGLQRGLAEVAVEQNSARTMVKALVPGKNDTAMLTELVKGEEDAVKKNEENLKVAKEGVCGR